MSGLGKESLIVRPLKNFQLPANSCVLHDTAVCFEDLSGFAIGNFHSPDHRVVPAVTLAEVVGMKMIGVRSEEHTSELQSLMRISYAGFYLKKKKITQHGYYTTHST